MASTMSTTTLPLDAITPSTATPAGSVPSTPKHTQSVAMGGGVAASVGSGSMTSGSGSGVTLVHREGRAIDTGASIGHVLPTIACCLCGVKIQSNPSNMCLPCLGAHVDLAATIPKTYALPQCPNCHRFESAGHFTHASWESRELLALCLRKMARLTRDCRLVDAGFLYTEPHSRRVRLKLTVQREAFSSSGGGGGGNAILQQTFTAEFVVTSQQCVDCQKSFTEHTWTALVQVRQKGVKHRKTLFYLEQLLLRSGQAATAMSIKEEGGGLDFYFHTKSQGQQLVEYLSSVVPVRVTQSVRVVSTDTVNNTTTSKHTFGVEIAPVCKGDLVCLPPRLATQLGGISPLLLCYRVTASIYLLDPLSLRTVDVSAHVYWRNPFVAVLTPAQLIEYTVLDIDVERQLVPVPGTPQPKSANASATPKLQGKSGAAAGKRGGAKAGAGAGASVGTRTMGAVRISEPVRPAGAHQHQPAAPTPLSLDFPAPEVVTDGGGDSHGAGVAAAAPANGADPSGSADGKTAANDGKEKDGKEKETSRQRHAQKLSLAGATVARSSDLGVNDDTGYAVTHLGFLLKAGNTALGYDVTHAVLPEESVKVLKGRKLPDIILVKKTFPKGKKKNRQRAFKLKRLGKVASMTAGSGNVKGRNRKSGAARDQAERDTREYDDFLQDVADDPELRRQINLYAVDGSTTGGARARAGVSGHNSTNAKAAHAANAAAGAEGHGMKAVAVTGAARVAAKKKASALNAAARRQAAAEAQVAAADAADAKTAAVAAVAAAEAAAAAGAGAAADSKDDGDVEGGDGDGDGDGEVEDADDVASVSGDTTDTESELGERERNDIAADDLITETAADAEIDVDLDTLKLKPNANANANANAAKPVAAANAAMAAGAAAPAVAAAAPAASVASASASAPAAGTAPSTSA